MRFALILAGVVLAGCSAPQQPTRSLPVDPATVKRCEPIWKSGGWDSLEHCVAMQTEIMAMSDAQMRALGLD